MRGNYNLNICIAYTPRPASENPNILYKNDKKSLNTYYRMIVVSFYSLRVNNPFANLILTTTENPPTRYLRELKKLNVQVKIIPFLHKPPNGYCKYFVGSFFLIDAILNQGNLDCLYLDPDIICLNSIEYILTSKSNILAFNLKLNSKSFLNELSFKESLKISQIFYKTKFLDEKDYKFYGAGFHYIPKSKQLELSKKLSDLYTYSLSRFREGKTYFTTEEHILTSAYSQFIIEEANTLMKVVWTALRYRTVDGSESNYYLLHLPSEKEYGFKNAYRYFSRYLKQNKFLSQEELIQHVHKTFNLNKPSKKRIFDRLIFNTIRNLGRLNKRLGK